nr:MAG TPA: hypothetical protein [Caudoviricetes sp.]
MYSLDLIAYLLVNIQNFILLILLMLFLYLMLNVMVILYMEVIHSHLDRILYT